MRASRRVASFALVTLAAGCTGNAPAPPAPAAPTGVSAGSIGVLYSPVEAAATSKILLKTLGAEGAVTTPFAYSETVISSRDGRWLARFRGTQLRIAPSADLTREEIAARAGAEDGPIVDAVFSVDGSSLAFLTELLPDDEKDPVERQVYVVNRDGTGRIDAGRFSSAREVFLVAFDARNGRVYWAEGDIEDEDEPTAADLITVDVATRRIVRTLPGMATDLFTRDFSKMYWADTTGHVYEMKTDGTSRRLLFDVGRSDTVPDPGGSSVEGLLLTPDESALIIAGHQAHASTTSLVFLPLSGTAKRRVLMEDVPCDGYPDSISPDGKTLWIGSAECAPKTLDLATGRTSEVGITEAVDLWAWLAA